MFGKLLLGSRNFLVGSGIGSGTSIGSGTGICSGSLLAANSRSTLIVLVLVSLVGVGGTLEALLHLQKLVVADSR